MSLRDLVHLTTDNSETRKLGIDSSPVNSALSTKRVDTRARGWFVDRKAVYNKLFDLVLESGSDSISLLKDVVLIADSRVSKNTSAEHTLEKVFKYVIEIDSRTDLSIGDIVEILDEPHPEDYIIGGTVDLKARVVTLFRGDLSMLIVSFDHFKPSSNAEPDFSKFKVIDDGRALKFGKYEASIYPLLYERDSSYRKRINAERKAEDKTLAACLFRARKIHGLNQDQFGKAKRETINRIELGKVKRVHAKTMAEILKALKLKSVDELLAY